MLLPSPSAPARNKTYNKVQNFSWSLTKGDWGKALYKRAGHQQHGIGWWHMREFSSSSPCWLIILVFFCVKGMSSFCSLVPLESWYYHAQNSLSVLFPSPDLFCCSSLSGCSCTLVVMLILGGWYLALWSSRGRATSFEHQLCTFVPPGPSKLCQRLVKQLDHANASNSVRMRIEMTWFGK